MRPTNNLVPHPTYNLGLTLQGFLLSSEIEHETIQVTTVSRPKFIGKNLGSRVSLLGSVLYTHSQLPRQPMAYITWSEQFWTSKSPLG